jgi:hypothetical protein
MPKSTFVEIPEEEQAEMLAALRRARSAMSMTAAPATISATGYLRW